MLLAGLLSIVHASTPSSETIASRFTVIQRGLDGGFGVVCSSDNVIIALKGRAASDGLLKVGDTVVSLDGDE